MRDTSNLVLQPHCFPGAGRVGSEPQAAAPTALSPCSASLLTPLDSGTLKISLPGTRSPLLWEEPITTSSPCSGRSLSTPRYCGGLGIPLGKGRIPCLGQTCCNLALLEQGKESL